MTSRSPLLDTLKAVAALTVMFHHFMFYGPLADACHDLLPGLADWMTEYGRMAVQLFLVMGGFLAAKALAPTGESSARLASVPSQISQRYIRLAIPFLVAVGVSILCANIARPALDEFDYDFIPDFPTLTQLLSHLFLMQDLVGESALTTGAWYVAIDLQLFSLLLLLRAGTGRGGSISLPLSVGLLSGVSLFYFNRDATWDATALYFFGSYGLGALAWWLPRRTRILTGAAVLLVLGTTALAIDFRPRIAIALAVALSLWLSQYRPATSVSALFKPVAFLGRISYSVFLMHFPVFMLVSAYWVQDIDELTPLQGLTGIGCAAAISLVVGAAFFRGIEQPLQNWLKQKANAQAPACTITC